jgi:hypothetical protein
VLDAIYLENLNKPTITIIQDRFERAAALHAKAGGLPLVPIFIEPAPEDGTSIQHDVEDLVMEKIDLVVEAFTRHIPNG